MAPVIIQFLIFLKPMNGILFTKGSQGLKELAWEERLVITGRCIDRIYFNNQKGIITVNPTVEGISGL